MREVLRSRQSSARRFSGLASGHAARFRFRIYFPVLLTLLTLALLSGRGFYSLPAGAQSGQAPYQQDLEQVFSRHEDLKLDPQATLERVRESGHLSLVTATRNFEIQLRPNDLRAPN
jgi:hypothetical protein